MVPRLIIPVAAALALLPRPCLGGFLRQRTGNPLLLRLEEALPPFDAIQPEHVVPAVRTLLAEQQADLAALEAAVQAPGFKPQAQNLLVPLSRLGERLGRAFGWASHLHSVKDCKELREALDTVRPEVVEGSERVSQSLPLYRAVKALQEDQARMARLSPAQQRLVRLQMLDFTQSGIGLEGAKKEEFNNITHELSSTGSKFSENELDATKSWKKLVLSKEELRGLPDAPLRLAQAAARNEAGAEAKAQTSASGAGNVSHPGPGLTGPFLISLDGPSVSSVLSHCENQTLRKEVYLASISKASELLGPDNAPLVRRILELRQRRAELLGMANYAELAMESRMATLQTARELLEDLLHAARPHAQSDLLALQEFAKAKGHQGELRHWDMGYWGRLQEKDLFGIEEEELRPYFPMDKCLKGLFKLAETMFGVQLKETQGPVWHQDVRLFQLSQKGSENYTAHLYLDLFARPGEKRGGAWQGGLKGYDKARDRRPVATIVASLRPPEEGKQAFLSFSELHTLFHEFGHALQSMLTTQEEASLAGMPTEWDAVELPSQFMEYWLDESSLVVQGITKGSGLPEEKLAALKKSRTHHAGLAMLGQLHLAFVDLDLHTRPLLPCEAPFARDAAVGNLLGSRLMKQLPEDRFLNHFQHIFAGGYAAGYYSYKWAEVLSADAFSRFEEEGATVAGSANTAKLMSLGALFRDTVLAEGGGRPALDVFTSFRGRAPSTAALLKYSFGSS